MTLLISSNKKHICIVTFINVISKVIIGEVFMSIVVVWSGHNSKHSFNVINFSNGTQPNINNINVKIIC
jgi:hypothetical protein